MVACRCKLVFVCRFLLLVFVLLMFILVMPSRVVGQISFKVNFGVDNTNLGGVSAADARIAFSVWIVDMLKQLGFQGTKVTSLFLSDFKVIDKAVENDEVDLLILNAVSYIQLSRKRFLDPLVIASVGKSFGRKYQLVAPKGKTLDYLRGEKLNLLLVNRGSGGNLPLLWLHSYFLEKGISSPSKVFHEIRYMRKPSRCALPVFFGQAAACVVTKSDLEILGELNPQVVRELSIIAESEPLVEIVVCLTKNFQKRLNYELSSKVIENARPHIRKAFAKGRGRAALLAMFTNMEHYSASRQFMLLFRFERWLNFKAEDIKGTIDFYDRCRDTKLLPISPH